MQFVQTKYLIIFGPYNYLDGCVWCCFGTFGYHGFLIGTILKRPSITAAISGDRPLKPWHHQSMCRDVGILGLRMSTRTNEKKTRTEGHPMETLPFPPCPRCSLSPVTHCVSECFEKKNRCRFAVLPLSLATVACMSQTMYFYVCFGSCMSATFSYDFISYSMHLIFLSVSLLLHLSFFSFGAPLLLSVVWGNPIG